MANITEYLNKIKTAVYGRDVRGSIHDGIKKINDNLETTMTQQKILDEKFKEQIKNMTNNTPSVSEIVEARTGVESQTYTTLGERLDEHEKSLKYLKKQQTLISKFHEKLFKIIIPKYYIKFI